MRLGAIAAVLAVGIAIPFLHTEPDSGLVPVPAPDIGAVEPPLVYDLDFADARHGYALWGRCTNGRDYRCERKLLVTEDGVTWTARGFALNELAAPDRLSGRIVALGSGRLMVTDLDAAARTRFHSADSGQSWRVVPLRPTRTVEEIPPDSVLETHCIETVHDMTECRRRRLVITLADTGERVWLATPPALTQPLPESRPADDGSWWVSGRDPATGRWTVAVSRDAGRSWSLSALPVPSGLVLESLSSTGSGPNRYVLATGWLNDAVEPRNLVAIFRSTDGGGRWTQTWHGDGQAPRTLGGAAVVTADGGLFVAPEDVGAGYRSVDGGASFTPVLDGPRLTSVRRTRAGFLAVASDRPAGHYLTSPDGVHWTPVSPPA
jgi:hypothetical protein